MAIDDNTSYELTGSQIKDFATKIKSKADSSSLAPVATSGDYNDLNNLPTPPIVNNGALTIKQNGKTLGTFTANQSTDTTINLENSSYSTSEVKTNATWIDGKPIYKKTIDIGTLPNATTKTVAHGISNLGLVIKAEGFSSESSGVRITFPFSSVVSVADQVAMRFEATNIVITTGLNRSNFSGYVTLWYTKTTD